MNKMQSNNICSNNFVICFYTKMRGKSITKYFLFNKERIQLSEEATFERTSFSSKALVKSLNQFSSNP